MIQAITELSDPHKRVFKVQLGGHTALMSYADVFARGHSLWLKGRYAAAREVFAFLAGLPEYGCEAGVFLAHCLALGNDYAGCSQSLRRALSDESHDHLVSGSPAVRLHEAFVYWSVGLLVDARAALLEIAAEWPEFSVVQLLLADLSRLSGRPEKAIPRLRAVLRSAPESVAAIEAEQLLAQMSTRKPARQRRRAVTDN